MASNPQELGAKFDAHIAAEFKTRDIDATIATMGNAPHVTHVPTMTGGNGRDNLRHFYKTWFIGHWPENTEIRLVSRTIGEHRLIDELIISFNHDCDMPAILPGVKPTGRKVTIPFVVVVGFDKDDKIEFERSTGIKRRCLLKSGCSTKRLFLLLVPSRSLACSIRASRQTRLFRVINSAAYRRFSN